MSLHATSNVLKESKHMSSPFQKMGCQKQSNLVDISFPRSFCPLMPNRLPPGALCAWVVILRYDGSAVEISAEIRAGRRMGLDLGLCIPLALNLSHFGNKINS